MNGSRWVLLVLASPRAAWASSLSRWSTDGTAALEVARCLSWAELEERVSSGRRWSAVMLDGTFAAPLRQPLDVVEQSGIPLIVVSDESTSPAWERRGARGTLSPDFSPTDLERLLTEVAEPVPDVAPSTSPPPQERDSSHTGVLVTVCGTGGTGASTVAAMLAQGAASLPGLDVCLADFKLRASQGVAHHVGDVVPCLLDALEAHSHGDPPEGLSDSLCWYVPRRGYVLLSGLPKPRDWMRVRPTAFSRLLLTLRGRWNFVVADTDADLESEEDTGSPDIEMRNAMARLAHESADVLVVVGQPGPLGLHAMITLLRDLVDHEIAPERIQPVVNHAPRSVPARASLTKALAQLAPPVQPPLFQCARKRIAAAHLDLGMFPSEDCRRLLFAVQTTLELSKRAEVTGTAGP